ncbi:MAG: DUF2997 domain-containing protein [Candidatus Omnitrophica bacterium]|jgi:hypothetical protein|nr:DUF2997 domain-containing protein [Candidatus Omnitrophota bacterium]
MNQQKVIVKINKKTGKMTTECDGFIGDQCDAISQLEAQLGMVTHTEDKSERYLHLQPDYVPNYVG